MKTKINILLLYIIMIVFCGTLSTTSAQAQVKDSIILTAKQLDSIKLANAEAELAETRLNEMNLQTELEQLRTQTFAKDSVKLALQKIRIDSLRNITVGIPILVDKDTLFVLYAKRGGHSPIDRATSIINAINILGQNYNVQPDSLRVESTETITEIMYDEKVIASVTDQDALWENSTRDALATKWRDLIVEKLVVLKEENSLWQLAKRIMYFALTLAVMYALIKGINYLFRRVRRRIVEFKDAKLKPVSIKEFQIFDKERQAKMLVWVASIGRYILILIMLLFAIPLLFSIFPQTEGFAYIIWSYIWNPTKSIFMSLINFTPNLLQICVIYLTFKYVLKGLKYISEEIATGNMKLTSFYPDWARPTFQILRFLLYAFMVVLIFPLLPKSDSPVFQGVSVFLGLIATMGSSTVIGNIIAGMVITYMRPFTIGDRIKIKDITGNVLEKSTFVTRIKTPKNEIITIPNSEIMSNSTTNYSTSARTYGLIIHSNVTVGYEVPWKKVHEVLIEAALATPGVSAEPQPFILETTLADWYLIYQINAYITDADKMPRIYSALHQNIHSKFDEAGIELLSPQYLATRNGDESTLPKSSRPQPETNAEVNADGVK